MITRLETPDYQTRLNILYKIATAPQYDITEDIIQFLASELTDDVRQLKGGFFQVVEKASLMNEPISMSLAESVVGNMVRARKAITMKTIQTQVCQAFGIKREGDSIPVTQKTSCPCQAGGHVSGSQLYGFDAAEHRP